MPTPVISVDRLSKRYLIRHQQAEGFRHRLEDAVARPFRRLLGRRSAEPPAAPHGATEEFWALRDVSFQVNQGDVLGVIGRNGAGKSTLLKVLSRITEPTSGSVRIRGRVSSLLEVGTGFHPELTGRENIFVNGAILGMTRQDIRKRFDEIVAFADIDRFLDTPVKRYSSGMQVRLAFAVAAHLEPEILIVDEVLAVGDLEFQKKCLGTMRRVARTEGRTVLFVSHNLAAVRSLCTKGLYFRNGRVVGDGDIEEQITRYCGDAVSAEPGVGRGRHQLSDSVACESLELTPNPVPSGGPLSFSVELSSIRQVTIKELAVLVYSGLGTRVAILDLRDPRADGVFGAGRPLVIRGRIERLNLVEGEYAIGLYVNCGDVMGDFFELQTLSVLRRDAAMAVSPYAPHDRGYVELDYDFAVSTDAVSQAKVSR